MSTWHVTGLRAGRFLLDAGGMFGVIPRVVWSRTVPTDEKGRVELQHNCLVLESAGEDAALGRRRRVVIEVGTGDKLDAKMSAIFGLDGRTIETALAERGVGPGEVDHVIASHLHFDHAGGLTRRVREGEKADWTASHEHEKSGDAAGVKLTFANAEVIVQREEWEHALDGSSVMTRTYYKDHLLPLTVPIVESGRGGRPRVRLVESPEPYRGVRVPGRDEYPPGPLEQRMTEVLPGVRVMRVPGHTWGQQAVVVETVERGTVVFTPDVLPTAWHVGAAYSLAYDVESYTSMLSKRWLLKEAAERGWTLYLDHEPGNPWRGVEADGQGWWRLVER
jgi:glyoxylase-like metal-dependent hydrolase (beta-lactamase superfamily II)